MDLWSKKNLNRRLHPQQVERLPRRRLLPDSGEANVLVVLNSPHLSTWFLYCVDAQLDNGASIWPLPVSGASVRMGHDAMWQVLCRTPAQAAQSTSDRQTAYKPIYSDIQISVNRIQFHAISLRFQSALRAGLYVVSMAGILLHAAACCKVLCNFECAIGQGFLTDKRRNKSWDSQNGNTRSVV